MNLEDLLPYVSIALTICGFLFQHFKVLAKINERLAMLETKISLFWSIVEKELPRLLKHPDTKRQDELLDKLSNGDIAIKEMKELKAILQKDSSVDRVAKAFVIGLLDYKINNSPKP